MGLHAKVRPLKGGDLTLYPDVTWASIGGDELVVLYSKCPKLFLRWRDFYWAVVRKRTKWRPCKALQSQEAYETEANSEIDRSRQKTKTSLH